MSDGSKIEWLARAGTKPATWNPIRALSRISGKAGTHCERASEGCRYCYAEAGYNQRFGTGLSYTHQTRDKIVTYLDENTLAKPLHWRSSRTIFVCSTSDIFGDWVPDDMIDRIFAIAALCPQHTFIFLTKRAARMQAYFDTRTDNREECIGAEALSFSDGEHCGIVELPLPNVWLGVSAETQKTADERIPHLLNTPAAIRFVSCEPMLGKVDLRPYLWSSNSLDNPSPFPMMNGPRRNEAIVPAELLHWVICGGESGPHARPMHPDWVSSLRNQCDEAGVPFFFKSWGEWKCVYDRDRDDPDWRRCSDIKRASPKGQWLNLDGGTGFHGERVIRVDRVGKSATKKLLAATHHHAWPEVRA